ncbi:hypothetical protein AmDm5_0828 [Acetobacter malorum]|nr:hypothetical protein AmDm5_0828 [Acetobacter malorum]
MEFFGHGLQMPLLGKGSDPARLRGKNIVMAEMEQATAPMG